MLQKCIDTGISLSHPDIAVAGGVTFVSGTSSHDDDNGHGTHVAGIVAAINNDIGVIGTAPSVLLFGIKVLNDSGGGTWSSVLAGIDWAITNEMDVINLSLGASSAPSSIGVAINAAEEAGTIVVATVSAWVTA